MFQTNMDANPSVDGERGPVVLAMVPYRCAKTAEKSERVSVVHPETCRHHFACNQHNADDCRW